MPCAEAKVTIAIVNKSNYSLLQSSLNIDDLVDPRMTTIEKDEEEIQNASRATKNSQTSTIKDSIYVANSADERIHN